MTTEEWDEIFPITKKQIVYIPIREEDEHTVASWNGPLKRQEGYFYTEGQLKQLLSDYTDKIVENAKITYTLEKTWDFTEVDKESITNQLSEFLKTIL